MARIRLDRIVFDAGTQIRAAIDPQVVTDYAEQMTDGAVFPPIVLFHDGNQHFLADGFHRFMAAQRIKAQDISADVQAGTKEDALRFALGANKKNGKRLTDADKKNAIQIARSVWPEMKQTEIASLIGCTQQYVSQVLGEGDRSHTSSCRPLGRVAPAKVEEIARQLRAGASARAIARTLKTGQHTVERVRQAAGLEPGLDKSKAGVSRRRERMREMAAEGYSSRQISAEVGLSEDNVRATLKREGVEVRGDKVTRGTHHHDANRIIAAIVADAENLTEGVGLIEFTEVDRSHIADWLRSLQASRDKLGAFIRKLMKEQQHGEAA